MFGLEHLISVKQFLNLKIIKKYYKISVERSENKPSKKHNKIITKLTSHNYLMNKMIILSQFINIKDKMRLSKRKNKKN